MQKMRVLTFCLLIAILIGCGGEVAVVNEETAVSAPTAEADAPTMTAEPETAVSDETASEEPETAEAAEIVIPVAPTSTFNPDGFSNGSSRFISLNDPDVISASAATWLSDDDIVIGVVQNGEARAYPIRQMAFHHIANDTLGGEPYLVTY